MQEQNNKPIQNLAFRIRIVTGQPAAGGFLFAIERPSSYLCATRIFSKSIYQRMPKPSERGAMMPQSPIRKLVPLANKAKAKGVTVYHLNIGQPDIKTPEVGLEAVRALDRTILEYSPSEGILSFREKLVDYYSRFKIDVTVDDIIVTTGGSEAVLFAFLACLDPGDEIIVPEPAYANYTAFAISAGAVIKPIFSSIETGFALPPVSEFEKIITPKTRAIMICNPNNPTGYLYTQQEMNQIRDLVKKYDLYLFSDEVYREFCYTGAPYISAFHLKGIEQNVVLVDSVSKRYSECGIRIGALITKNKQVRNDVMKFCQARLSPPLLGQIVAEASLDAPEEYMLDMYNEYVERRKFLIDSINRIPGCYTPIPMGAFYTVARLPIDDADKFCAWLLEEFAYENQTVMIAPASGFYTTPDVGRDEVRLAYVIGKEFLAKAMLVLEKALEVYPGRTINR
jgi:aspartate aminotransferase